MAKNKFDDLDADFKTMIEDATDDEIKSRVAAISLENERIQAAKKGDEDLKEKAAAFQEAGKVYRESAKGSKLMIQYARFVLEGRGKA